MNPLLTVVVPVYGVESYVDACLRSLRHASVEVIAVDDASPDGSAAVLARHPWARTVRLPANVGLGAARNIGLSLATGTYVWYVDGDDMLPPAALSRVLPRLAYLDPDVLLVGSNAGSVPYGLSDVVCLSSAPALLGVRQAAWNRIVRVDLLRHTGIRFPDGLYEDVPYSHLVLACARRIAVLPEVCYLYRTREGSLTHTASVRHFDVFDQYERLFSTLAAWRASPRLTARLHALMVRHYLTVLGAPDRVPPQLRRAFFARMVAHERRYRPACGPPLPLASWAVRLGSYDAYRLGYLARRVWRATRVGNDDGMTHTTPEDVVDHGVTDVLTEDEVVHVPPAAAELAQTLEHEHASTFVADVPDWDAEDPLP
jgi:glycosyltransferase involved in cell wall biosynthesis